MSESKEPIRLRQRKTRTGMTSLYLDIYLNGKRSYEYLKLYLVPEKTRADKEKNRQTIKLADTIRAKRVVELHNKEYGFKYDFSLDTLFYPYYRSMCQARLGEESRGNWGNWYSCLHHLMIYDGNEKLTFRDITPKWVQGFKDYLEKDAVAWAHDYRTRIDYHKLANNSKLSYFNKLRACLNKAFEDRIIPYSPCRGVENFKEEDVMRMYLTIDEVRRLSNVECICPAVKQCFLFSCLTGLRRSD
ncbi:MAG: phage integrase SAM-like domain-containing protein, partial [Bacteroidaceae bacterium]|nr:phage integrase SAM-like domain-containing protein [Bacteroidaceae bacterium]